MAGFHEFLTSHPSMPFCSEPQHFQLFLKLLFLLQHLKYFIQKSLLPGGREHCSCEIWRQHCASTCGTFKSWLKISDWLVPVVSFYFCFVLHFFFRGTIKFIHHHVNIWTEHWQAGAAQLPMWGAPCILQVRIHCLYFVESFAFQTTLNTILLQCSLVPTNKPAQGNTMKC